MRTWIAIACMILTVACVAAEKPLLDRLAVHATGSVMITVPVEGSPSRSVFRLPDGSWSKLNVQCFDDKATFLVPSSAGGRTVVLLNVPDWLELDDEAAPTFESLSVSGNEVDLAAEIDLGHLGATPDLIRLVVKDDKNPIDAGAAMVSLDGLPLGDDVVQFQPVKNGPETRIIEIKLKDVSQDRHLLAVRVPDAAGMAHFAELSIRFDTAPLLRNGSFESVEKNGDPTHWAFMQWSSDADTKAEQKVVDGGHTGDKCIQINGIAGGLNLLCGQQVFLEGDKTYVVRGFYKSDAGNGYMSMIADGSADKEQYLNSPRLTATDEWTAFEWEFETKPAKRFNFYLRNSKGSVWFDDVVMQEKE